MVMCACSCDISRGIVKAFNILFLVISLGIMGFGGYLFTTDAMEWIGNGMAIGLVAFGGFVCLLSVFGLYAVKEREDKCCIGDSKWLLGFYTVSLTILILAQIVAAVVVAVAEADAEQFLQDRWNDMKFEQQVDIMEEFECGPFSETFGEHMIQDVDDIEFYDEAYELSEEMLAELGMAAIEHFRDIVHPYFNDTDIDNTTICRIDEVIENAVDGFAALGVDAENTERVVDVCFQDCYENFKDEFLSLSTTYIAVVIAFACMEIFLLVASCCTLCDEQKWQPDGISMV